MTNIPEARRILEEALTVDTPHEHIREALKLMTRVVRPARRGANKPMTNELGDMARRLHYTTRLSNAQIGRRLGVDGGRVSEAINGCWQQ